MIFRPFVFLLLVLFFSYSFADSESDFQSAKKLVQTGNCKEVPSLLEPIIKKKFRKSIGEKSAVILAECEIKNKNKENAKKIISNFLEYYTASLYIERIETLNAILEVEAGNVYEGTEQLLRIFAYTKNNFAKARAKEITIQILAASLLSANELQTLLEKYPVNNDINGWLELQLGRESQNERRYKAARYWYNKVLKRTNISERLQETAQKGLESLEGKGAGKPTILILAPLSGAFAEFGTAAIHGVTLGIDAADLKDKIHLRIADTKADASIALNQTKKAILQDSIIAIVGPIMSAPTATVAAWLGANFYKIPLITPTATDNGIAQMGPNIFQLNITMNHLAKTIAKYAMDCFNIREFAIISPVGDYGSVMAENFTQAVESSGGKIIAYQNYIEGRSDYKTEFDLLRALRYKQINRKKNIANGVANINAVNSKARKEFLQDSVASFPAIFMPSTNPVDAGSMVGHLAFNKIKGLVLGTSGFYGRDFLINGKNQANGSFFSVPASEISKSDKYQNFVEKYKEKWGEAPSEDNVALLSYDAIHVIIEALKANEENLAKAIKQKASFDGVLGKITFKNGNNTSYKIVTVEKNRFKVLDACPAEEDSTEVKK